MIEAERVVQRYKTASLRPETAISVEGDKAYISVLIGHRLSLYEKKMPVENLSEIQREVERLSGSDIDKLGDDVDGVIEERNGFEFSLDRGKLDRGLARVHSERLKEQRKLTDKALRGWMKEGILAFIEDIYSKYKKGVFRKEPCITAGYIRGFFLEGGELPREHAPAFKALSTRQQLSLIKGTLETLRRQGKIQSSSGVVRGRDVRCYEPKGFGE